MNAQRGEPELGLEHRGQQVLARVLLHVIEAPRPVELPLDAVARLEGAGHLLGEHVGHPLALVHHVHDAVFFCAAGAAQHPEVEALPARGWIERRTIQVESPAFLPRQHRRFEGGQVSVTMVEPLGHAACSVRREPCRVKSTAPGGAAAQRQRRMSRFAACRT